MCDSALQWESDARLENELDSKTSDVAMHVNISTAQGSQGADAESSSRADEGAALKIAKTIIAAEFFAQAKGESKAEAKAAAKKNHPENSQRMIHPPPKYQEH